MTIRRLQMRQGTAAQWTAANPTLLIAEIGVETDTHYWKIGDGVTAWTSLAYSTGATGAQGVQGVQGIQGPQGLFYLPEPDQPDEPMRVPGVAGAAGAAGTNGAPGLQLYYDPEPGEDGLRGPPGPPGAAGAAGSATKLTDTTGITLSTTVTTLTGVDLTLVSGKRYLVRYQIRTQGIGGGRTLNWRLLAPASTEFNVLIKGPIDAGGAGAETGSGATSTLVDVSSSSSSQNPSMYYLTGLVTAGGNGTLNFKAGIDFVTGTPKVSHVLLEYVDWAA